MHCWRFYWKFFGFMFLLRTCNGEVSLRVLLQPPMVTLECLILNEAEKASVIMWCPNDNMCFQSCSRLCDKNCPDNKIECTETNVNNGMKYVYTFDTRNVLNQGEWTCHYGAQKSSTVIFFNETNKRISISTAGLLRSTTTIPLSIESTSKAYIFTTISNKAFSSIQPKHVIILLVFLALSLCSNIVLVVRSILYKVSTKKTIKKTNLKKNACLQKFCIRLFCVENFFNMTTLRMSMCSKKENPLLSRQASHNMQDCNDGLHIQPAILLDNGAYRSIHNNHLFPAQSILSRSQSFPSKYMQHRVNGMTGFNNVLTTPKVIPQFSPMIHSQESVSQIIYDDVAEPSINYMPLSYFASLSRPTLYKGINRLSHCTISMDDLPTSNPKVPATTTSKEYCTEETTLKDEISSRVEISKEMINQADTLLRRANTLLKGKNYQNRYSCAI